ncbi:hypothetical protein BDR05DRAFT_999406 [Suillus weaverae]|nr:hypothetical protein BDR05DRAFT_999406 [Suillus weaverae]
MSTAQQSNEALLLVAKKISQLIMRGQKMAVTSLLPILLFCVAEIQDNLGPNDTWVPTTAVPTSSTGLPRAPTPLPPSTPLAIVTQRHNLFVPGNNIAKKSKTPSPEAKVEIVRCPTLKPAPKKHKAPSPEVKVEVVVPPAPEPVPKQ